MTGRKARPEPRWQQRVPVTVTPAQQLEVAYDRLRSAAARVCRNRRDVLRQAEAATFTASVLREAADAITACAEQIEKSETRRGDSK
jgi:hypothetical protein